MKWTGSDWDLVSFTKKPARSMSAQTWGLNHNACSTVGHVAKQSSMSVKTFNPCALQCLTRGLGRMKVQMPVEPVRRNLPGHLANENKIPGIYRA